MLILPSVLQFALLIVWHLRGRPIASAGFSLCRIASQVSAVSRCTTVSRPLQPEQVQSERHKKVWLNVTPMLGDRRAVNLTMPVVTTMCDFDLIQNAIHIKTIRKVNEINARTMVNQYSNEKIYNRIKNYPNHLKGWSHVQVYVMFRMTNFVKFWIPICYLTTTLSFKKLNTDVQICNTYKCVSLVKITFCYRIFQKLERMVSLSHYDNGIRGDRQKKVLIQKNQQKLGQSRKRRVFFRFLAARAFLNRSQLRLNVVSDFLCESTSATSRVSNNAITFRERNLQFGEKLQLWKNA